ncbi:MAG: hypothetical protein HY791_06040 [Deltaproteobacteria bacterium]|nr:hypothetical protein [Deltaproteobacteria bacterium]
MVPAVALVAIVAEDQTVLRAAPEESAPRPAILWKGDWVEVRGRVHGYLSVYDHRHERAGYVAPERVREYELDESTADRIWPVVEFLKDSKGDESLGIGMIALFLRVAPTKRIDAGVFERLGSFAERLARRASGSAPGETGDLARHLEVAASYGVTFRALELEGRSITCYDGEAFRRALALGGSAIERARAALALTDSRCFDPSQGVSSVASLQAWVSEVLDEVDAGSLPAAIANRIHTRRGVVRAELAHWSARRLDASAARTQYARAVESLKAVDETELFTDDRAAYDRAVVRVAAERWAGEAGSGAAGVRVTDRNPGETCIAVASGEGTFETCTYGFVWRSSIRMSAPGVVSLSVEPIPGWLELWVIAKSAAGYGVTALVPAAVDPELGYVELAGWTPDGQRMLVAREFTQGVVVRREFSVVRLDTFDAEKSARSAKSLEAFRRFSSADWRRSTFALR